MRFKKLKQRVLRLLCPHPKKMQEKEQYAAQNKYGRYNVYQATVCSLCGKRSERITLAKNVTYEGVHRHINFKFS